jgi:hypothetical protein
MGSDTASALRVFRLAGSSASSGRRTARSAASAVPRIGLWRPKRGRWGTARPTITGRRTGQQRSVIVGYFEDGPNLVTLAMNGWADPEPAWWPTCKRIPTRQWIWSTGPDWCGHALPKETNYRACGPGGAT